MENNFVQHISSCGFSGPRDSFGVFQPQTPLPHTEKPKETKRKGRGRKKLRPGNPLKTEVLDKYWLRAFKNFIKTQYLEIKLISEDPEFWSWYMTKGKPGKNTAFLSYNSTYKETLFINTNFCSLFAAWGLIYGFMISPKKILKASWEFYYNYLFQELIPRAFNQANQEHIKLYYQFIYNKVCASFTNLDSLPFIPSY